MKRSKRLLLLDRNGRWRNMPVFSTRASRHNDRWTLHVTRRLKQVQRAHYIRLESFDWVRPRDGGQALGSEMEYMRWLMLSEKPSYALPVTQVTLHKTQVR